MVGRLKSLAYVKGDESPGRSTGAGGAMSLSSSARLRVATTPCVIEAAKSPERGASGIVGSSAGAGAGVGGPKWAPSREAASFEAGKIRRLVATFISSLQSELDL